MERDQPRVDEGCEKDAWEHKMREKLVLFRARVRGNTWVFESCGIRAM